VSVTRHVRPPEDLTGRAAWTSELVYGTLTVIIALAGIDVAGGTGPSGAGAIVLVGAAATWTAHAYSALLGHRATTGKPTTAADVGHALRHSMPILLAALPATIAMGGASVGWWAPGAAFVFASAAGIAVLAGAGWFAARATGADIAGQVVSMIVTTSIGVAIVIVEILLHH
jgi:hypothetical protein